MVVRRGEGPVAVISGGATGIGLATVRRLVDDGWRVAVLDADEDAIDDALDAMGDVGERLIGEPVDAADEDQVGGVLDRVCDEWGVIHGFVHAAHLAVDETFEATDVALFRRVLDVDVVGAFAMGQAVAARMREGGAIVHVASVAGLRGIVNEVANGAAHGALVALTRGMAVALASQGIRVNAVALGPLETPLVARTHGAPLRTAWLANVPQRRYGLPDEAAGPIAFLLSEEASFVSGEVIAIDGGFLASGLLRTSGAGR